MGFGPITGGPADPPYTPALDPRGSTLYYFLAREWGVDDLAAALMRDADQRYAPTWASASGEFTWGFGLDEAHPRGQWNAAMAAGEANDGGGWWRLANTFETRRFGDPTIVGVEFPSVVPTQAWWDRDRVELVVSIAPSNSHLIGRPTTFRVTNLPASASWTASPMNGHHLDSQLVGGDLEITTAIDHMSLVVHAT